MVSHLNTGSDSESLLCSRSVPTQLAARGRKTSRIWLKLDIFKPFHEICQKITDSTHHHEKHLSDGHQMIKASWEDCTGLVTLDVKSFKIWACFLFNVGQIIDYKTSMFQCDSVIGMSSQPRTDSFPLAMYVTFDDVRPNQPMIIVGDLNVGDTHTI